MARHNNWRDCKAWRDYGLPFSTSSNEACKLYDAAITQYVGWYDEDSVGGLSKTLEDLHTADPTNVMARVLANGLDVMGTGRNPDLDPSFVTSLTDMMDLANTESISQWEKSHVKAISLCADGYMKEACGIWEHILVDYPKDILAIKFAHDAYFYLGYQPQMRDSIARVLPYWQTDTPLYSYLLGMHAFGLEETNLYQEAEKAARKALRLNAQDAWATHALAHVLEMEGRYKEGIIFLSTTVKDWSSCEMLACHNYWHWALYHTEKGEPQGALDIFDTQIGCRAKKSGAMLDIVDACSLLYRLQMEEVEVGDRWEDVSEICRPHVDDHLLAFNDVHLLMSFLGAQKQDTVRAMMDSMKAFISEGKGTNNTVTKRVGATLCEAFVAYDSGDYCSAVDLLLPLRYQVLQIGGSNAQRDVFSQFLIHAALKSSKAHHKKLARSLLFERKTLKDDSPLTDRLVAKTMAEHT